jgi:hypothetical protein
MIADLPPYHLITPLLLDKLGKRNSGSRNRLITSIPLFDWAGLQAPHEAGEGKRNKNAPRDQGGNDGKLP